MQLYKLRSDLIIDLQICDMVAVARIINATLVIPELDKRSFWHDSRYQLLCLFSHFVSIPCIMLDLLLVKFCATFVLKLLYYMFDLQQLF